MLSNNIKVITFGMDETGEKRTHKTEIINTGLQNPYIKNRDRKAYLEVLGVDLKEIEALVYSV